MRLKAWTIVFLLIISSVVFAGESKQYLNDMAAFLGGMELSSNSELSDFTSRKQYAEYKKSISEVWERYAQRNLPAIENWRKSHLNPAPSRHLFYAYSGPDLLNALVFFPEMEEYTMVALEKPGDIDSLAEMKRKNVFGELTDVKNTLKTFFKVNYFRTNEMKDDIRTNSFTSVSNLMFFFLARLGYEIQEFKTFQLDKNGKLVDKTKKLSNDHGFEIVFKKRNSDKIQRVRYFRVNLFDDSFKFSPFQLYIKQFNHFNAMLKAASYLMHEAGSVRIRKFIAEGADFILQDDSGVPIRYFSEKEWDFKYYGTYRILKMFKNVFQPKLAKYLKEKNAGSIPFQFGYGSLVRVPNLMVGKRK